MTKIELIADLSTKVQRVGEHRLVRADVVANCRIYDVDVYITVDANGTESIVSQRIHVYDEDDSSETASYAGSLRKNFEEPVTIDGNKLVFDALNQLVASGSIKSYSFSHTAELGNSLKAGIFTLINNDDTESNVVYSVIDDQVVTAEYKKVF